MLTIDALKAYGANVEEGLGRCMNNEPFYLRMINMTLMDSGFEELKNAVAAKNTKAAFEAAHKLKGATGNVALTPIFKPVSTLSDMLKGHLDAPMTTEAEQLAAETLEAFERLKAL